MKILKNKNYFTVGDVARKFRVSRIAVLKRIYKRQIPVTRISKFYMIHRNVLRNLRFKVIHR